MTPMANVDFSAINFFEQVSLSAREPTFSAGLAWLFGERSSVSLPDRLAILGAFVGSNFSDGREIEAATEWNKLDLLITVRGHDRPHYVAIEIKIKAGEGKRQLSRYDSTLEQQLDAPAQKIFLTLRGWPARTGAGWRSRSYLDLFNILETFRQGFDFYAAGFSDAIGRLGEAASEVANDPEAAAVAFREVHQRDALGEYVTLMRLHTVLQKAWMFEVASRLSLPNNWRFSIEETRGNALLDVCPESGTTSDVRVGLQLQGRVVKLFCAPNPYPGAATAEQHKLVESELRRLGGSIGLGEKMRLTRPKDRGFRSVVVANLSFPREPKLWSRIVQEHVNKLLPR